MRIMTLMQDGFLISAEWKKASASALKIFLAKRAFDPIGKE
jgi:hypothetical protein